MRRRLEVVERARLHVGHRETSPNRSPLIDAWLRRCGLGPGYAWCAAFASWCLEDVALAGALKLGAHYPLTDYPEPGDLMFFPTNGKGAGHIGIVVDVRQDELLCIEGNSADRVRYVRRLRSEVFCSSTRDEDWAEPDAPDWLPIWADAPLVHVSKAGTR